MSASLPPPPPADTDRICGPAAVTALFAARPEAVLRLFYMPTRRREAGALCKLLAAARKPYREVPAEELARIAGTTHHGGMVAIAAARSVPDLAAPFPDRGARLPVRRSAAVASPARAVPETI
jgi:TrmH RNA methyltransferase